MTTQRQEQIEREVTLLRGIAESTDARLANILTVLQSTDARLDNLLEVCESTQIDIKVGNQAILEVLQEISRKLNR
jgi:hypothetical protein